MSYVDGVINEFYCERKNNGDINFKPALDCYFQWHSIGWKAYSEVIKSVVRSREYYAVVKETNKETKEIKVFAVAGKVEFQKRKPTQPSSELKYRFTYYLESSNPKWCNCPISLLKLLEEPENDQARLWRKRCEQANKDKRSSMNTANLPLGSIVELTFKTHNGTYETEQYQLVEPNFQFRKPWWCKVVDGEADMSGYCPKKILKSLEDRGQVRVVRYGYAG